MFARVNTVTVKPGADQAALGQATVAWRQLIQRQAGYVGHVAVTHDNGHLTVITLWESHEAAQGWSDNPDFQRLRHEHLAPNYAAWETLDGTAESAELRRSAE
jgi:heme-degrading monooxygenase HmoA